MKNKLTRKLMLSAFTLLFAVISLGASTYAWFVMSENAQVKAFSGTVTAGQSGLEIKVTSVEVTSPDNTNWRSTELDLATDFADATDVQFTALQNNKDVNKFAPNAFAGLSDTEENKTPEMNGNYVAFRLWFRLADITGIPEDGKKVYLTDYDLTTEGNVNDWYVNKEYDNTFEPDESQPSKNKVTVGQSGVKYYVSDAARIAFYNLIETKDPEGETIKEEKVNKVYEAETLRGADGFKSNGIGDKGALSYYNNVNGTSLSAPEEYYTSFSQSNVSEEIGTLTADNNLCYIDVYVWVEGWDQECINAIFNQTLKIVLKFSLNPTTQEED